MSSVAKCLFFNNRQKSPPPEQRRQATIHPRPTPGTGARQGQECCHFYALIHRWCGPAYPKRLRRNHAEQEQGPHQRRQSREKAQQQTGPNADRYGCRHKIQCVQIVLMGVRRRPFDLGNRLGFRPLLGSQNLRQIMVQLFVQCPNLLPPAGRFRSCFTILRRNSLCIKRNAARLGRLTPLGQPPQLVPIVGNILFGTSEEIRQLVEPRVKRLLSSLLLILSQSTNRFELVDGRVPVFRNLRRPIVRGTSWRKLNRRGLAALSRLGSSLCVFVRPLRLLGNLLGRSRLILAWRCEQRPPVMLAERVLKVQWRKRALGQLKKFLVGREHHVPPAGVTIVLQLLHAFAEEVPTDHQPQQHQRKDREAAENPARINNHGSSALNFDTESVGCLAESAIAELYRAARFSASTLAILLSFFGNQTTTYVMPSPPKSPAVNTRPRIILCYPVEPQHVDQIAAAAQNCDVVDAGQERIAELLATADIFCGHCKVPVPWDDVVRQGRLRWIQSSAAGLDHCLVPSVVASDITVTSASGVLADQVADHTIALLTGLLRSLPTFFRAQGKREFIRRPTRDLHGARVGIIGLGGNGRRLAEVLSAFRCNIIATDWYPDQKHPNVSEILPAEQVDKLLPSVDILILAAPLTNITRHMIDARRLALLPKGAIVVNVARGSLVVTEDLIAALESGHLGAAAVDVTDPEPLPRDSRLWELPNVIITPHVGGQSATRIDNMTNFFCENLHRYFSNEPLVNLVDKRLGFPMPNVT